MLTINVGITENKRRVYVIKEFQLDIVRKYETVP